MEDSPNLSALDAFPAELPFSTFHQAARDGQLGIIKWYLHRYHGNKRKINKLDGPGLSALHYAIQYNHMDIIKELITFGADIHLKTLDEALSPIHFAVKYFKQKGQECNICIPEGFTQSCLSSETIQTEKLKQHLASVSYAGKENAISLLLNHGADTNDVGYLPEELSDSTDAWLTLFKCKDNSSHQHMGRSTALSYACGKGNTEVVKLLLFAGESLMKRDEQDRNPLHFAMMGGSRNVLQEIILDIEKYGGIGNNWSLQEILNCQTKEGKSILHLAIKKGDYEMVSFFINKGADVNLRIRNGDSPLHLAAEYGNLKIVKLLLSIAAVNKEAQNYKKETPLHKATRSNQPDVISCLISKNCRSDVLDDNYRNPLDIAIQAQYTEATKRLLPAIDFMRIRNAMHYAVNNGMDDIVQIILRHSKKLENTVGLLEKKDGIGNYFLHIGSNNGNTEIVDLLIRFGADPNVQNNDGDTPLHLACRNGHFKTVLAFINHERTVVNKNNKLCITPLDVAFIGDHKQIASLLLNRSDQSIDFTDPESKTILYAIENGSVKCVSLLLERKILRVNLRLQSLGHQTPLQFAASHGQLAIVKILLTAGASITLRDNNYRNALDFAVTNSERDVTLELLNQKGWMSAMKNRFITKLNVYFPQSTLPMPQTERIVSPMREMIKTMPDVTFMILNKCSSVEGDRVELNYELINDIDSDWDISFDATIHKKPVHTNYNDGRMLSPHIVSFLETKENHPLHIMCQYRRIELLKHPLVLSLIHDKWRNFGRPVFYSRFLLYLVFLFFLTGYVLVWHPLSIPKINKFNQTICVSHNTSNDDDVTIMFHEGGKYMVILLSCTQLLMEIIQLKVFGYLKYLKDPTNWMEWVMYILAIIFVYPNNNGGLPYVDGSCHQITANIGACVIFLAWINALLFIQKIAVIGMYVPMFAHVTKTFLKFSIIFILFVVAFSLAFLMLFNSLTFENGARSLMKIVVMMIGEFEFDTMFNNTDSAKQAPPLITWFFFLLLVITMTILLMNIMVGLAVDDIKGMLDKAEFNRLRMLVEYLLGIENIVRYFLKKQFIKGILNRMFKNMKHKTKTMVPPDEKLFNRLFSTYNKMLDDLEVAKEAEVRGTFAEEQQRDIADLKNQFGKTQKVVEEQRREISELKEQIVRMHNEHSKEIQAQTGIIKEMLERVLNQPNAMNDPHNDNSVK